MSESNPSMSNLTAEAKREWIAELLRQRKAAKTAPCSFAQRRLWFLDQMFPGAAGYNQPFRLLFEGRLDEAALTRALKEIVRRHESLRTTFGQAKGHPVQIIAPSLELGPRRIDLGSAPEGERETEALRLSREEAATPFDLQRGPLIRATLLRLAETRHVLLLTLHHIVSDGWSLGVLFQELAALYEAFANHQPSPLPELPIQYADFAQWQRQWLQGGVLERQLDYWTRKLEGVEPLALMTDRPRPPLASSRGASLQRPLANPVLDGLRDLSQREGATLFMTMLAGYQCLLHRLTGQQDVIVGSPIANRNRREIEGLIGFFVNNLSLRARISGGDTFVHVLRQVRESALEAFEHQDVPFERLVEALRPDRDVSRHPLFQVTFAMQNAPMQREWALPDLKFRLLEGDADFTRYDLEAHVLRRSEGLTLALVYSADLFEPATISRWLRYYERLLEAVVANPELRVADLPLLEERERNQILVDWNRTDQPFEDVCLHHLVEAQVRRRPEAVAVVCAEQSLTYAELNRRANHLAHHLQQRGVGPDVLVGLCLERSLEMVVGLLGVLKAGGAYVPLDPSYPIERLDFMLQDSQAPVVLTQRHLVERLPRTVSEVICLDAPLPATGDEDVSGQARPEHLAYVIYTSGSTGQPKGVMIPHRAIANHMQWMQSDFPLTADDRVLQKTAFSFDASVWEFYAPLIAGAQLVMADPRATHQPGLLLRDIQRHRITILQVVPTLLQLLLAERAFADCRSLRRVFAGGEALTREVVETFFAALPAELHNLYGPTEAAIDATAWSCVPGTQDKTIPIGRPIANMQAYLLDSNRQVVPPGVAGELYLGGAGLARGYWRHAEWTAEKFVAHPFRHEPGARLYRTGDLARFRADGAIEFLGRVDDQVKLRGFRIELAEIESVLARHPSVDTCVVIVREDQPGNRQLVGYVVPRTAGQPGLEELRAHLKTRLPDYMVPSALVFLEALPKTPNGKVDRRALPVPTGERAAAGVSKPPQTELERRLAGIWAALLGVATVGRQDNFFDLGGHSLLLVQVHARLEQELGRTLSVVELFQYPTIESLARHLSQRPGAEPVANVQVQPTGGDAAIAIIGMALRFPGAASVETFWSNLRDGVESISFFTAEELEEAGLDGALVRSPHYVRARAVVEGADLFDAGFFGCSPREAEILDPQQRVFLECAWEALERAGCDPRQFPGRIGLYAGVGFNTYWEQLRSNLELVASVGAFQLLTSNDKDHLPTRVSYKLNLRGPSVSVQTACSTSLVAVHLACQSLRHGEADVALAGGATIVAQGKGGYLYVEEGIASPDGHCRPFDDQAQGTVPGSGVGMVVLKRLSEALRDGDSIHAVIRGSAVNNDGSSKVGYTAPSVNGQAEVIRAAQAQAGIAPETIGYIEAHGTGTALGDPIEIEALTQAFQAGGTPRIGFCPIGSVKGNVGHLDAAAGVAGLIKTVLALEHGMIPPTLHFHRPNPKMNFDRSPFFVNARLLEWPGQGSPRRAGVSSFGIGGTNAHVVVEEAPLRAASGPSRRWQLLVISARTASALETATVNLRDHLETHAALALPDVAYTLQRGRKAMTHRRVVVCREREEAVTAMREPKSLVTGRAEGGGRPVVYLFSGQGSQYPGMGRELYEAEPVFRDAMDQCVTWLESWLGLDLRTVLWPADGDASAAERLNQTALTQPALFAIEWALTRLWRSWGIEPEAMIGHSIGEYVAATVAGVFSLEDGLRLVTARGRLMQRMPPGAMLAVPMSAADVQELAREPENHGGWSLAAINAPRSCVLSGPADVLERMERVLGGRGLTGRRLRTSHAFHSAMLDPMLEEFRAEVKRARLNPPGLPFLSNVTGTWIDSAQATDPEYWVRQARQPVRFSDGFSELLKEPARVFLEIGPGHVLAQLARQHLAPGSETVVVHSLRHPRESRADPEQMLAGLGRLWVSGVNPDWAGFSAREQRQRVALPTYPFERQRYWIEPRPAAPVHSREVKKRSEIHDWFYVPAWKRASQPVSVPSDWPSERWLLFVDETPLSAHLARALAALNQEVLTVTQGERFAQWAPNRFTLNPGSREDYDGLCEALRASSAMPTRIVHLWSVATEPDVPVTREHFDRSQRQSFYSLLFLVQALARARWTEPLRLEVITTQVHALENGERIRPEKSTLLGLCKVIPQEYANLTCRSIDLPAASAAKDEGELVVTQLLAELAAHSSDVVVAYRGPHRWVQIFEPVQWPASKGAITPLRSGLVCLITGGLGGVGLVFAEHLARVAQAKLVLVGRSTFPDRQDWGHWLETHDPDESTSRRIRRLLAIEDLGAELLVLPGDAADAVRMAAVVSEAERRFGAIHGVIHAAGVGRSIPLQNTSLADCEAQFQSKIHGLLALDAVLAGRTLDFRMVTSSLASILGGLGFAAYAPSNQFLDAFAQMRAAAGLEPWTSVNWEGWNFEPAKSARGRSSGAMAALALSPSEGAEAFARVLSLRGLAQIAVSTGDLQLRIEQWLRREPVLKARPAKMPAAMSSAPDEGGTGNGAAPRGEVEQLIAEVWQEALGVPAIGVHDNFFDLGGNSLVAVQMLPRLREAFQVALPVHALFDAPSVAALAKVIEQARAANPTELERLEALLALVEQTPEHELESLLEREPGAGATSKPLEST